MAAAMLRAAQERLEDAADPASSEDVVRGLIGLTSLGDDIVPGFVKAGGLDVLGRLLVPIDGVVDPGFAFAVASAVTRVTAQPEARAAWAAVLDGVAVQTAAAIAAGLLHLKESPDPEAAVSALHSAGAVCLNQQLLSPDERVCYGIPKSAVDLLRTFNSMTPLEEVEDGSPICSADSALTLALGWADSDKWVSAFLSEGGADALCGVCRGLSEAHLSLPLMQPMLLRLCAIMLVVTEHPDGTRKLNAADTDRHVRDWFCHRVSDVAAGGSRHFGVRSLAQQLRAQWEGSASAAPRAEQGLHVGDRVVRKDSKKGDSRPEPSGEPKFFMLAGEVATVVELDGDGDVRLVDARGSLSDSFRRSKFYRRAAE
eukprot:TRINITY_DN47714_c0_g1_i1.p2 TRINITY_DN47714_c0_g1~~TRINITY_DN47714_c0_g1_i1.p2  ORF type:complete len:394 (+),score=138.96 TRINITY_DN47714_c0_g1_i1:73-1182(+)